jgi:hypothetical protein
VTKGSPSRSVVASTLVLLIKVLGSAPACADTCTVPGTHASIQAAVADPTCTTIDLAGGSFRESLTISRDLGLRGAPSFATTIEGQLVIRGAGTDVQLTDLVVDTSLPGLAGCFAEAVEVQGGAVVDALRLDVRNSIDGICNILIFFDGFESGDTSAWSSTVQ